MPGGNGTGPRGEGPMTGKGMGYCILKKDPENPSHIEGFTGINLKPVNLSLKDKKLNSPYLSQTTQNETNFLKYHISFLEEEIKAYKKRINELETQKQETKKG